MGLYRFKPTPSGRMGTLWTLSTIREAAVVEFGCMGHMFYSGVTLKRTGVNGACRLYSTHIDETDISLGRTDRLNDTIRHVVQQENPRVIFLLPSAVPEMIGTDLTALCEELQPQFPEIRLIPFGFGGFDILQHRGVQEALLLLAKTLPEQVAATPVPTFNLIGSCADLFRFQADAQEIVRVVKGALGIEPLCVMTSDTSVSDLQKLGAAHMNLVLRREGEPAARHLKKRFGTPYLLGRPYGIQGTIDWIRQIAERMGLPVKEAFLQHEQNIAAAQLEPALPHFRHRVHSHPDEAVLSLGGHADVVKGILSYGCNEMHFFQGSCWCDSPQMGSDEIPYYTEEQWSKVVKKHRKGFLMASGEALEWGGHPMELQISNPDTKWRLHPYDPPFVGFRGAVHLANLWINQDQEE